MSARCSSASASQLTERGDRMMMARRWSPVVMLCAASGVLAAQGPRRAIPEAQGSGSIRGVVYDSLIHAPLEGAIVSVVGGSGVTTTDAGGRFRLDSVPAGRVFVSFEHADLDSVGLS